MLKRNDKAQFDLLAYFEGKTFASGIFEDRAGRTKRTFTVELEGRASGNTLTLDESFVFDDGERQTRTWTLTRDGTDSFTGTCSDAASPAKGQFDTGRAVMQSSLRLDVGSRKIALNFDDAFYDIGNGAVLNRSTVTKWGFHVGQVLILFRKG